jgi:hypothetical protein
MPSFRFLTAFGSPDSGMFRLKPWGEPVTRHGRSRFALIVIQSVTVKSKNLYRKNPAIVLLLAPGKLCFRKNLKEMSGQSCNKIL